MRAPKRIIRRQHQTIQRRMRVAHILIAHGEVLPIRQRLGCSLLLPISCRSVSLKAIGPQYQFRFVPRRGGILCVGREFRRDCLRASRQLPPSGISAMRSSRSRSKSKSVTRATVNARARSSAGSRPKVSGETAALPRK